MSAWLIQEKGVYKVGFRYAGKLYKRSLKTRKARDADAALAILKANLHRLDLGLLDVPDGADLPRFLLTGGKQTTAKPVPAERLTLRSLFEKYQAALPEGAKSDNTLGTEATHRRHILRIFGEDRLVALTLADLQHYVNERAKERGRWGRTVNARTIGKEIATLRAVWKWGRLQGLVKADLPKEGLVLPRTSEKEPFKTRKQIEQQVARGGLTAAEEADLWASLYLELDEIGAILDHARNGAREPWVYPMIAFVAHTGARRSEALRSRIDDIDFETRMVRIREKKKEKGKITFRHVPLSVRLAEVMHGWFAEHPGGQWTFTTSPGEKIDVNMSNHHFHWALEGSEWHGKVAGWHTFRHSFASNCARKRVDQRMIDRWMGHQTEAMRKRYQHLFPDDQHEQLALVFGGGEPERPHGERPFTLKP